MTASYWMEQGENRLLKHVRACLGEECVPDLQASADGWRDTLEGPWSEETKNAIRLRIDEITAQMVARRMG